MNLQEYQAKELLRQFNLPLLKGTAYKGHLDNLDKDLDYLKGPPWVVKSQIHAGGRGAGYFKKAFNNIFIIALLLVILLFCFLLKFRFYNCK